MQKTDKNLKIIIIGAGFAGIGMGIQLKRKGEDSFVILERANDVGGTWRDNHYPGIACDVPSHLYSFSFLTNAEWSRVFSPGNEIQQYLRDCVKNEELLPKIRFGADMLSAHWDKKSKLWSVTTPQGIYVAPVLITGTGHLADGHMPDVEGLDTFTGDTFHSADWNHDIPLNGKRVGLIGSGASAIQIVPEMAKLDSDIVIFQRSAAYVIPRADRDYTEAEKRLFRRDPDTIDSIRSKTFWEGEYNYAQRRNVDQFLDEAKKMALGHLEAQVSDPVLRAKLTPDYEIGCKRLLISNQYFPAMSNNNVTLETSAISRVEGSSAISTDGNSYELDVLIFATGFEAIRPPFAKRIYGSDGISLDEQWSSGIGMQAYQSTTVAGFPNLFIINGPNTGLGHNSVVFVIEAQIDYILGALDYAERNNISTIEISAEAESDYMDKLHERSQGTVWLEGGCKSWYVDSRSGRLTIVWPDYAFAFRDKNGKFSPDNFKIETN